MTTKMTGAGRTIRDVWKHNFQEEMDHISMLSERYRFVGVDTEFPGVVAHPVGVAGADFTYQSMKVNVNLLKLIQVGISLCDENGEKPDCVSTWQFNLKFDIQRDMYADDSIKFLVNNGMNFEGRQVHGISLEEFSEMMMGSGLVGVEDVTWISFHGGHDFGYFLKILQGEDLPATEDEFFEYLMLYFPRIFDIKFLIKKNDYLNGGLTNVASMLGVERVGQEHQAGSDCLLTLNLFFRLQDSFYQGKITDDKLNILYGYGVSSNPRGSEAA